jgi:hypothetical protein
MNYVIYRTVTRVLYPKDVSVKFTVYVTSGSKLGEELWFIHFIKRFFQPSS